MLLLVFVSFTILPAYNQEAIYFASTNGLDNQQCGSQIHPCASINQVIINNPNGSYTVLIADGSYPTSNIDLSNLSIIIFQGTLSTVINASWKSVCINTGQAPGFEFHDVTLALSGDGIEFSLINFEKTTVGFYNVIFIYTKYSGNFVEVKGGSLILNNCVFDNASFAAYGVYLFFIFDTSDQLATNITISYSTFSNIHLDGEGVVLMYCNGSGPTNVLIDNSVFANSTAEAGFVNFNEKFESQQFTITNCLFTTLFSVLCTVEIALGNGSFTRVQNTTWYNTTAQFTSGALDIYGSPGDVVYDNTYLLDNLTFITCTGSDCGALFTSYISLTLSNSVFADNMGMYYYFDFCSDVVQLLGAASENFTHNITNSYSSSDGLKAVICNEQYDTFVDISDQLPNPPNNVNYNNEWNTFVDISDQLPNPPNNERNHLLALTSSFVAPSSSVSKRPRVIFTPKRPQLRKDKEKDLSEQS